jgi:hypothetical protein
MSAPFELSWLGGPAEAHYRKARPGIDDFPWGTLDVSSYRPEARLEACASWTDMAFSEYKAVVAFTELLRALAEAQAPLDLLGMASSFVADEVLHVELASRMAMELGGATPCFVDFDKLYMRAPANLTARQRASEMVVRISCVAEALSGRLVGSAFRQARHPLTRAVLRRITADESLHYRLGGLYLEWAAGDMDDSERARLAQIALDTLQSILSDESSLARSGARDEQATIMAVNDAVVLPLARHDIVIRPADVERLFEAR